MTYKVKWRDIGPQIAKWYQAVINHERTELDPIMVEMDGDECTTLEFRDKNHYLMWMLRWS